MGIALNSSFTRGAAVPLDDSAIVANITARNSLLAGIRYAGMTVYVVDSDGSGTPQNYQLQGGIANANWAIAGGGDLAPIEADIDDLKQHKTIVTTVAPTVNDDVGDFIKVGTFWFNITTSITYILIDNTLGAAVWVPIADPSAVKNAGTSTDNALMRWDGITGKVAQNSIGILDDNGELTVRNIVASSLTDTSTLSGIQFLNSQLTAVGTANLSFRTASPTAALYFQSKVVLDNVPLHTSTTDTTAGGSATLVAPTKKYVRLTGAMTSLSMIPAGLGNQELVILNATGKPLTIRNKNGATAANQISTTVDTDIIVPNNTTMSFVYDQTLALWIITKGVVTGFKDPNILASFDGSDITLWGTGNNAAYLGGGTLAGVLVAETAAPLQGPQSYKYTQAAGSLNDWLAAPIIPVDLAFRGKDITVYLTENYNGLDTDIQLIPYDATAGAVLPSSIFVPASSNSSMMKATFTIPLTCTSLSLGFQVKAVNSGKVFTFDSIVLTKDSNQNISYAQTQTSFLDRTDSNTNSVITGALATQAGSGIYSYNATTGIYTMLKAASVVITSALKAAGAASVRAAIYANGLGPLAISTSPAVAAEWVSVTWEGNLAVGETFQANNAVGNAANGEKVSVLSVAYNTGVLTPQDMFSTDTANLAFSSAATLATLGNGTFPVGTFIGLKGSASNVVTQTATWPQTAADINLNGIRIFKRTSTVAGTDTLPNGFAIFIGKGLKGADFRAFKNAGQLGPLTLDYWMIATDVYGLRCATYEPKTGIVIVDSSISDNTGGNSFISSEGTGNSSSAYFTISAQRTALPSAIPAQKVIVIAANASAQSVTSSSSAWGNWTKSTDNYNCFNAVTGVFTSQKAAYYKFDVDGTYATYSWPIGTAAYIGLQPSTGAPVKFDVVVSDATGSYNARNKVSNIFFLPVGATVTPNIFQSRGSATTMLNDPTVNGLTIMEI